MRRRLAAVGVLASALCMLVPAAVSAHTYNMRLDCDGLRVSLRSYTDPVEGETNNLQVFVDGNLEHDIDFDVQHIEVFDVGSPFESHSVEVRVRAWDDDNGLEPNSGNPSWSFDWQGTLDACAEPTPAPTPDPTPSPRADEPRFAALVRTPICDGDVPYLRYNVDVVNTTADRLKITFVNPDGADFVYDDLPLKGRVLWPGAEVDSKGNPVDWPGWRLVDGEWVEGDKWDWTRPAVRVRFTVNPTRSIVVRYPPSSPNCTANPPNVPEPTLPPNLDLPPTDTAGDYGMTSGDSQGAGQGILFLLAVMAAAGSTYGIRTVRRRAAAKR